ncbi:cobalamin biosynthesis protein, partial [Salinarimonas sp.]|uniref:cobalamin biosynthesis protein n=1 Tax=Salinarimonas sp. TaxID=2766526 RepID=UPI00391CDEAF
MGGGEGMIVAGVGFRSGVDGAALAGLVAEALAAAGRVGAPIAALATLESISHAPGFADAASRLGTRALTLSHEALLARDAECPTRSERSLAAHGLGSVAEAAALAAAGPGSRLVSARIANATATCALAAPSLPGGEGGLSSGARKAGWGPGGGFASNLRPHPTPVADAPGATLPAGGGSRRP